MTLHVTVPTTPVAQPRPRAVSGGKHARLIQADHRHPIHEFKACVRRETEDELNRLGVEGVAFESGVQLTVTFCFDRPKSRRWKTKAMPPEWHLKKPDIDNLLKGVMDALTGLAWRDDTQVCFCSVSKYIAAGAERPHVKIVIRELGEGPQ